ncbi:MAG TPA: RNA polymerase sigma factor [Firmicutes bacterium]|jgi:RNA polymerase sigma factor (sigma-70 family)|nr:RNA polymerase sigma factor [Bacillota bacterium]
MYLFLDEEFAAQLQHGDKMAFEAIVHRYHEPIYAYIVRMGSEYHIAADITQEVFLKVCKSIHQYKPDLPFRPWIYTIASNTYKDYLKKAYVQRDVPGLEITDSIAVTEDTPETAFLENSERAIVVEALKCLEEIYREVLILRYYQDLKLEEIAQTLQIPIGTVKSRLSTALHKMKTMLVKEEISNVKPAKR